MSRNKKKSGKNESSRFKRFLGWTVLLALVFSAGLITGERIVRSESVTPLVSVSARTSTEDTTKHDEPDRQDQRDDTEYSFFDSLTGGDRPVLDERAEAKARRPTQSSEGASPDQSGGDSADSREAAESQKDDSPSSAAPAEKDSKQSATNSSEKAPNANTGAADRPSEAENEESSKDDEPPSDDGADHADKPPSRADGTPEKSASAKLPARYTLQVAAHPDMKSAKRHMKKLRDMGLEPHVISAAIPEKGKFYRVRVGKFHTMDEAREFQAELQRKNSLNTFVSPM